MIPHAGAARFAAVTLPAVTLLAAAAAAGAPAFEVLASARINNRTESVVFRLDQRPANVSAIRVRSGSLPVTLVDIEIHFVDGGFARSAGDETLPPGRQSRALAVDSGRAIRRAIVLKRPGLTPGETTLQLLGQPPAGRAGR